MLIKIKSDEYKLFIPLPNIMFLNNITAKYIAKKINYSYKQIKLMFKSVRTSKKALKRIREPLVYLKSGEGEEVIIKL